LVLANDSLLADALASMLAVEINLDVIRLTHRELGRVDHHSVVIVVDDGQPGNESIKMADLFRDRSTLLVIMISLKSRNIYVYESYQLVNPELEQVIHIVREFSQMNLKKKSEADKVVMLSSREMALLLFFFFHPVRRKNVRSVTTLISSRHFAGFDI
jgi:hypothetical protein